MRLIFSFLGCGWLNLASSSLRSLTMGVVSAALATSVLFPSSIFAQTSSYNPQANAQREFIMSCTYGVLAGTLIGAASLAFVDRPSENLNKVARGASLGLYAGILLGAYVIYVVPGMDDDLENNPLISSQFQVLPTVNLDGNFDGAEMRYEILSF